MRLIVIDKACDFQSMLTGLFKQSPAGDGASQAMDPARVAQIKLLNPHVDFQRLDAGAVLLLPDMPELNDSNSRPLGGDLFQDVSAQMSAGLDAVTRRIDEDIQARTAEQAAVQEFVHTEAVQQHLDRQLKEQLARANEAIATENEQAQQARQTVAAMAATLKAELAALAKVLE